MFCFSKWSPIRLRLICCVLSVFATAVALVAQVQNDANGTIISAPNTSTLTIPAFTVPAGNDRAIVIYFSTSNLQGLDFDSPNEMGGFYPSVTFNGQTLLPQSAGKRAGSNLGTVLYFAALGSSPVPITSNVVATYTDNANNPILGTVLLSAASFSNVLQTGISNGSIGNGSNASGPTVFVQSSPSFGYEGAITIVNLITNDTPPPTGGSQQTTLYTGIEAPYTVLGDFARADTTQGSSSFGYFTSYNFPSFRQYAYASSSLKCATNCSQAPLPLELLSFDASAQRDGVQVVWQTANERNTDRFEVERSAEGKYWKKLAAVPAAGFSKDIQEYSYIDFAPPTTANTYYRIKNVDTDDAYSYSETISVANPSASSFHLYPNPAQNSIKWSLKSGGEYQVYDLGGHLILHGWAEEPSLDVDLPQGVYLLTLHSEGTFYRDRFFIH